MTTDHLRFRLLAAAAIDEVLADADARALADHMASCAACRSEAAALARDHRRLADLGFVPTAPEVRQVVVAAARERQRSSPWAALAAAALLLAMLAGALAVGSALIRQLQVPDLTLTREWQAVPGEILTGGASTSRIRSVASAATGFVAVGSSGGSAAVWLSPDGAAWERVGDLPGGRGAEVVTVEALGPGLIAAGRADDGPAIWTSADGRTWSAAGPADLLTGAAVNGLAGGPEGWLAVGGVLVNGAARGATWASPDGVSWSRHLPQLLDGAFPALQTAAYLPDGRWVAFADVNLPEGPYVSADGVTWNQTTEFSRAGTFGFITVFGSILVGAERQGIVARWSRDGRSWVESAVPAGLTGTLRGASVLGPELFLLGGGADGPILLRSGDGRTFTADRLGASGHNATAYDVATSSGVEVVVGIQDGASAVWVRRR